MREDFERNHGKANMRENYEYSKAVVNQRKRSGLPTKIGLVVGVAVLMFSLAIEHQLVTSELSGFPKMLTLGELAGIVCIGISLIL